eukprot:scaffold4365_cov70-Phaeocystis_antarctica.AAC.13
MISSPTARAVITGLRGVRPAEPQGCVRDTAWLTGVWSIIIKISIISALWFDNSPIARKQFYRSLA